MIGCFDNLAVHKEHRAIATFGRLCAHSVVTAGPADYVPFVHGQTPVILRIDDSVLAPRQRYPAEGIAVANPAIQKHRPDEYPNKPERNMNADCDLAILRCANL